MLNRRRLAGSSEAWQRLRAKLPRLLPVVGVFLLLTAASHVASPPPLHESFTSDVKTLMRASPSLPAGVSAASVRLLQVGLSGHIQTELLATDLTGDGVKEVLLGTSRGLNILSSGTLLQFISTSSSVMDIALLGDVTGDGQPDLAMAVGDTFFPNIRVYDSASGERVWQYVPKQEVFIDNLMWTEQQTLTFDLEAADLNSDNTLDVIATSGYRLYALDGRSGNLLWEFEAADNLWRVAATPDLNKDGVADLAVGGQDGYLHALSGKDGLQLWKTKLVPKYNVIDFDKGGNRGKVDQSVWDIVPVQFLGAPWAVVSGEDGYVRLVNLEEGTVQWEEEVVEHVDAMLSRYYQSKGMNPTSPGDFHFFNLRVYLAPDITGDDVEEILAAAYLGRQPQGEQETRGAGLFLINPATGRPLWENTTLELRNVSQMEFASREGEPVILVPSGSVEVIDLQDGRPVLDDYLSQGSRESWYAVKDLGNDEILMASSYGDLIGVSGSGDILWDYPGVADVAVEQGDFTGDETQDILVRSRAYFGQERQLRSRVLYVVDGATGEMAWSYVMPYGEFAATGGIGGIRITPDLNQDGKQDVMGYIQQPGERPQPGEGGDDSQIVIFSGNDGAVLLKQPVVTQTYYGLWEGLYTDSAMLEQGIRDWFEADKEQSLPEEWARQEQDMRQDFEQRRLPQEGDQFQQERRQEFEGELQNDLEQQRVAGRTEEELATYEQQRRDDFEQRLLEDLASWEQERRESFEQIELPEQKANMERSWGEGFEEYELPSQMEAWQERLNEEEGHRRIDKYINSLDIIKNPTEEEGIALVVGGGSNIFIVSPTGELLWTKTQEPWNYQDPFTGAEAPEVVFGLEFEDTWSVRYRVPGDINGDGIDDLAVFTSQEIAVGLSAMGDGGLSFTPGQKIEFEQGTDPRGIRLVDDLDGDGLKEIFYPMQQADQQPTGIFMSPATGRELLRLEKLDQGVNVDLATADLDGDGSADTIQYRRFSDVGPQLRVMSGRGRNVLWERTYQEEGSEPDQEFEGGGWGGYSEGALHAAPIADITGDGVADLALVQNLRWQAGAQVVLYDVAHDEVVKEIVLEKISASGGQEKRWQPGLLVREVGDVTGDGVRELAVVVALGKSEEAKEYSLMVVDVVEEQVVADFRVIGSELFELGDANEFGVLGLTGEVYLVDVANELRITSPGEGSLQSSPISIQWTGVADGTFNQVFVDNVEVARTNEGEFTGPIAQGKHQIAVRSLDEYGRGAYRTVSFTVEKSSSIVVLAIGVTALLIVIALWFPASRFFIRYRQGKEHHG